MIRRITVSCFLFFLPLGLSGGSFQNQEVPVVWKAWWVSHPLVSTDQFHVVYARNSLELDKIPETMKVMVSADIRYKLYVNGKYIGQGPSNNDLLHYTYDSYDLAEFVSLGPNTIALETFSLGTHTPIRYETSGVKFIVQAEGDLERALNTGTGNWKVYADTSIQPTIRNKDFEVDGYFALGGGEVIHGTKHPWGWRESAFNDQDWVFAQRIQKGEGYGSNLGHGVTNITLSARTIPAMDETALPQPLIRSDWNSSGNSTDLNNPVSMEIPKNTAISYLLDQRQLTKGFPIYTFSKGRDAKITVTYAESLVDQEGKKGHRDEVEGKKIIGLSDIYYLDGGQNRSYAPLLQRVWRYILVEITTQDEELIWEGMESSQFVYPFEEKATFKSPFAIHDQIWETSWRTALLCTDETFMDCPYYEQLQYLGDTRIQALVSLYVSGDDRLMKNAINQFANSFTDEGIAQGRFPSSLLQYIPPFSLYWISMLHDFHYHSMDSEFTSSHLRKVDMVLSWFEEKLQTNHLLGTMPWWSYVDVAPGFDKGNPPGAIDGNSVILTLQYLYALQQGIELFEFHQKELQANHYSQLAVEIQQAIHELAFDEVKGLYADTPLKSSFSQHANILAILTDTAPESMQTSIFEKITSDDGLTKTNIYFKFYLHRAALKSGEGDYFMQHLDTWTNMLDTGLTTFSEYEGESRSDCHGWSASPNYEFLHTVAGIRPAKPHFKEVLIAPNLGSLPALKAEMPHPAGKISVDFKLENNSMEGHVTLPIGVGGRFRWKGNDIEIFEGDNHISVP